jgi:glycosyltransferase involved in cell wall biosynthesis
VRVLHLANVAGEARGGGIFEVAYNLFKCQSNENTEPYLWFPGTKKEESTINENNIVALPTFGNPNYGLLTDLFSERLIMSQFDIIHQHGIWLPTSVITTNFRRKFKKPVIIQPHGLLEPYRLNISKFKKRIANALYEGRNLEQANLLLACSEQEALNLKALYPIKDVGIIENGISQEFIDKKSKVKFDKNYGGKRILLFLSQINPLKGLNRLIDVIDQIGKDKFTDWVLLIAGFGNESYEIELKKDVKKRKLEGVIKFIGPQFGQDKVDLMSSANLFILPTFNENYGIVVAESLARSVPVLTTKGTPWEELETENCGFWVDNDNEGIMDGLLSAISKSDEDLKLMGDRGKLLISSKYVWENVASKTVILYEWLLGMGAKPDFVI